MSNSFRALSGIAVLLSELLLSQLDQSDPVEAVFQRVAWQFGQRHGGQDP